MQSIFGELRFDTGWKIQIEISLFGKKQGITLKARAYEEEDGITAAQIVSFSDYSEHQLDRQEEIENLLNSYSDAEPLRRFKPRTLLFERDGGYALLCDDAADPDDGIAVVLSPEQRVLSQDDYL